MTKREIEIKVRLNEKEAEHLNRQVEKCRLSSEAYLRHLIAGMVPRETPPPEYFAFMRELHYVGNLLNQIAQKAHVLNVIDAKAKASPYCASWSAASTVCPQRHGTRCWRSRSASARRTALSPIMGISPLPPVRLHRRWPMRSV